MFVTQHKSLSTEIGNEYQERKSKIIPLPYLILVITFYYQIIFSALAYLSLSALWLFLFIFPSLTHTNITVFFSSCPLAHTTKSILHFQYSNFNSQQRAAVKYWWNSYKCFNKSASYPVTKHFRDNDSVVTCGWDVDLALRSLFLDASKSNLFVSKIFFSFCKYNS